MKLECLDVAKPNTTTIGFEQLVPTVYEELRDLAARLMRNERVSHTLDATSLVHEAYLKLRTSRTPEFQDRQHLVALAARAMRQVLVNHAESRAAAKRGGGWQRQQIERVVQLFEENTPDLLALDDAIEKLAEADPLASQLVELRFFGGLNMAECASVLEMPKRTLEREWTLARAWLQRELGKTEESFDDARALERHQVEVSRSA